MFTINIEKECGCFKRSEYSNNMQFENKDDALIKAKEMESDMNQTFCQTHLFTVSENGDNFNIGLSMKPRETTPSAGGCCGGGHC